MHHLPSLRASGTCGEIRVGYQRAARLGAWELTLLPRLPRAFELRARLTETHDYWYQQQPQDLVLWLGLTAWMWPGVTFERDGDTLVATLEDRPTVMVERAFHKGELA